MYVIRIIFDPELLQVIEFIRKKASEDGNSEVVHKCDCLLPGDVRTSVRAKLILIPVSRSASAATSSS